MIEENDQDASELEETLLLDLKNIDMVKYNIRNYFNTHEKEGQALHFAFSIKIFL